MILLEVSCVIVVARSVAAKPGLSTYMPARF